jgi:hypothetical protein
MMRSHSRLRRWWLVLATLVVLGGGLALGLRTEAQDANSAAPANNGPEITADARGTASAKLVSMQDMLAADQAHGAVTAAYNPPFRLPTGDVQEYLADKAAAEAGPASARPGGDGARGADPVPLAPPVPDFTHSFTGLSQSGLVPPDTHGAIGHTQYVEVVNARVGIFNRFTNGQLANFGLGSALFEGQSPFDPRVLYDARYRRWVIVATRRSTSSVDTSRRFFVAVSRTQDATQGFCEYTMSFSGGGLGNGDWFDFPQLGMDLDSIIVTANVFHFLTSTTDSFRFAVVTAFPKAELYNCLGTFVPMFTGLSGTLAPPNVLDKNGTSYILRAPGGTSSVIQKFSLVSSSRNTGASRIALFGPVNITVPSHTTPPPDAPQFGTVVRLDSLDGRFQNNSTQVGDQIVNVHTTNFVGFATPRWYRLNTLTNTVIQSGIFFESGTSHDLNPHIAMSAVSNIFVTWATTNATAASHHNPRIRASGKQPADASIPAGSIIATSPTNLTSQANFNNVARFGDYSAVSLDPINSLTAWGVNEWAANTFTWTSRIFRFHF